MKRLLMGSVCALALTGLATAPALATGWSATLNTDYSYLSAGGGSLDLYNFGGSVEGPLSLWGLNAEADGGYIHSAGAASGNAWAFGGSLYLAGSNYRVAGDFAYHEENISGSETDYNYGVGAEYYLNNSITIAARGGGLSGSDGVSGGYFGGEAVGYLTPDLALTGSVDYLSYESGVSETDLNVQAEWLIWEDTPISFFTGYTYSSYQGLFVSDSNVFFVGLKLYANGGGPTTLVDHQRSGSLGYIGTIAQTGLNL